jgi:hypothetical protein
MPDPLVKEVSSILLQIKCDILHLQRVLDKTMTPGGSTYALNSYPRRSFHAGRYSVTYLMLFKLLSTR